ncbi:MAG TPA: PilT/PilU family type 4a pilus ATPase [Thermoanaerobaculaceae bacterium]|nr:PilT/PilU family type 4a pilus ATPase [Thermoanaerobaculaceae bacterium]
MEGQLSLDDLLKFMTKKGASDLHVKPMRPPLLRIGGNLTPIKSVPLKPKEVEEMIMALLSPAQRQKLEEHQSVDLGYGVPGVARFRCNVFVQRGSYAAVFRRIPFDIKNYADLNLPDVVATFAHIPAGMVLITGPTGSGKSTTLAAIVQDISRVRPCHIVTIEDPIEFLFGDHMATISQREVGTDTPAFREALRNAMRQDPDVIMVGEMRDRETMATTMTAAETGHLVFSTLHTNSAAQTIDRIIDTFPSDQQGQLKSQLAQILKAVVSMQLLPRADGQGLVPACEILVNSPKVSKHIEHGEIKEIYNEIETSVGYYRMQTMNQSLIALLVNGTITYDVARERSGDPEDLSLKLRKMFPKIEESQREGAPMPAPGDFAQIVELMEIKKLYEEQEERWKSRYLEKDEQIAQLQGDLAELRQEAATSGTTLAELRNQLEAARAERERLVQEANLRIDKLNERIRDLNQQMVGGRGAATAAPPPEKPPSGFFKR